VPVVDAQRETIRAFVERARPRHRRRTVDAAQVARLVLDLVRDHKRRSKLGREGSRLVDGLGAMRAATAGRPAGVLEHEALTCAA